MCVGQGKVLHVWRDESKVVFHRCASKEVALAHANHTICVCALFGSELESIGGSESNCAEQLRMFCLKPIYVVFFFFYSYVCGSFCSSKNGPKDT